MYISSSYFPEGLHLSLGFVHSLGLNTIIVEKSDKPFIRDSAVTEFTSLFTSGSSPLSGVSVCGVR